MIFIYTKEERTEEKGKKFVGEYAHHD